MLPFKTQLPEAHTGGSHGNEHQELAKDVHLATLQLILGTDIRQACNAE